MSTDPNAELVARLAHRPAEPSPEPAIPSGDWNAPIDETQADSMTVTKIIQGEFADLREEAAKWEPRPCPDDYRDETRTLRMPQTVEIQTTDTGDRRHEHVEGDPLLRDPAR